VGLNCLYFLYRFYAVLCEINCTRRHLLIRCFLPIVFIYLLCNLYIFVSVFIFTFIFICITRLTWFLLIHTPAVIFCHVVSPLTYKSRFPTRCTDRPTTVIKEGVRIVPQSCVEPHRPSLHGTQNIGSINEIGWMTDRRPTCRRNKQILETVTSVVELRWHPFGRAYDTTAAEMRRLHWRRAICLVNLGGTGLRPSLSLRQYPFIPFPLLDSPGGLDKARSPAAKHFEAIYTVKQPYKCP